ncbi:uncharacterized protein (DUF1800 family) [Granulicella aggregans]|uniref:Uncharacterized protein (DUF1800 family) n=1 Tax=Granulicella aggregans TaxID=474949 RepID=A0A7W7ZCE7_9BACT|nr:DUF1800 domain-containing protein [Granulicella aggregans]MBB5057163.1 uncharacterized protein (DUF1800 family) [Granulicella aggregans]
MLAYLNRFGFSFFFGLVVLLGCGSGVLQASGASPAAATTSSASSAIAVAVIGSSIATAGTPVQYAASLTGTSNTSVSWSIRGASTSENYGTISASGVYVPPAVVPVHNVISIVATSTADPTKSTATTVTIMNPVPVVSTVTATPAYHSTFLVNVSGSNFLPSSVILYGGYGVTTTFVSSTNLKFTLSSPPAAGTLVSISVATPAPGKTVSANYSFSVPATVGVTVTGPAQSTVSSPAQFKSAVTGTDNQAVTWAVAGASSSENYGTISASGVYTPPAVVPSHNIIAVIATSVVDTTKTATMTTTLSSAVPTISLASLTAAAKGTFLVDVQGSNYISTSYVQYLGYGVPTTVVSANEVKFTLTSPPAAGSSISLIVVSPGIGKTQSAPYTVTIPGAVAVSVTGSATVAIGTPAQFSAAVTGTSNTAVNWKITGASASENYGNISAAGLYTPPPAVPVHGLISISATSQADTSKSNSLTVTISNPVPAITSANLTPGSKNTFLVDVLGTNFMSGSAVLYGGYGAATTYVSSSHLQFTITNNPPAGSVAVLGVINPAPGRTQSANFNVTIPGAVGITVNGNTTAYLGNPIQYTATVTGTSNTDVTWSLAAGSAADNYGTISSTGLYTPPPTVPIHPGVTVVATSKADTTKKASLAVGLLNAIPVITSATAATSGRNIALVVNGSNFIPTTFLQFEGVNLVTKYVSPTQISATVTTSQTAGGTGPVIAITPAPGMTQSSIFTVQLPGAVGVTIVGASQVAAGETTQYAATVTDTTNTAVTWSVATANGANPGTISSTGLYTPPATGGSNLPVTITATSQAQATSSGSEAVTVVGVSVVAAGRLLDQSTFGPTEDLVAHVQAVGLSNFIDEQLAMPASLLPVQSQFPAACLSNPYICIDEYWWADAVAGPDQLRQRVSMTLMEMLVVSYEEANAAMVGGYSNVMTRDAFANWSTILHDMTLSPAMGQYLNMVNSGKPAAGAIANENFARENMQLFNTGLYLLNQDGTLQMDSSGNPIPTYSEAQVEAFARVFTGWTYDMGTGKTVFPNWSGSLYNPMVAVESAHVTSAKTLLNSTLPAGQTAEQDLDAAIQDVFNHPNVGPFVTKQLIQHLVKSNPSPEYVGRIAAVFANDGKGVRGNMAAVIKALLLDPEARAGDTAESATDGYLREPIIWTANILRALNAVPKAGYNDYTAYTAIDTFANSQGQRVFNSPTVFNFYPAEWPLMNTGLNAPQFALEDTATIMQKLTLSSNVVNNQLGRLTIDLTATGRLGKMAAASNDVLMQELSNLFLHGNMSSQMRTTIMNAISGTSDPAQRVRTAVYLIISSPQYRVIH